MKQPMKIVALLSCAFAGLFGLMTEPARAQDAAGINKSAIVDQLIAQTNASADFHQ